MTFVSEFLPLQYDIPELPETNPANELPEDYLKVCKAVKENGFLDPNNTLVIDLTKAHFLSLKEYAKVFGYRVLPDTIAHYKAKNVHVISIKIPSKNHRLMKYISKCDFYLLSGNPEFAVMNLCLKGHDIKNCNRAVSPKQPKQINHYPDYGEYNVS